MKKSDKIALFVVSLIGLGFSIGMLSLFYYIPSVTEMMMLYQSYSIPVNNAFAGYSAFICLCFLLLLLVALFFPSRSGEMVIAKDKGKLRFSKQAVESTIRRSFADIGGINFSKVRAKINKQPEKTKIYVKLSVNDSSEMVGLTEKIQNKIASALQSSLGITVKTIEIKVAEFSSDNTGRKENSEDTAQGGRVV